MAEGVAPGGPAQLQREESVLSVGEPDQDLKSNSDLRVSIRSPASKEPPKLRHIFCSPKQPSPKWLSFLLPTAFSLDPCKLYQGHLELRNRMEKLQTNLHCFGPTLSLSQTLQ